MIRLLRSFVFRPLRRDLLRTALTVLSVALGVGVVIAIDLAGDAAAGSFESSLETLTGRTDLTITANGGVDEAWAGRLATLPFNIQATPVIERQVMAPGLGAAPLYGVDPFSSAQRLRGMDPAGAGATTPIALSTALARRLNTNKGSALSLHLNDARHSFMVALLVDARDEEFALLDIADAQHLLRAYGLLDRIDIEVARGEDFTRVEEHLRGILPPGYALEKPGARSDENQRMLRAFRWNLRVLSYISLVVGAFLIYNTVSVSVVRRRAEIGVLRALGASRRTILWLFLGEALLMGLAGSALGVALGRVLAEGAVDLIASTVNSLYASSRPAPVTLSFDACAAGILAGAAVSLLSALAPAREAMSVAPASAMARGGHEHAFRQRWRAGFGAGIGLAALALTASRAGPVDGRPFWGYAAALAAISAAALVTPAVVLTVERTTRRITRGAPALLARRGLAAALPRTSVIVAALATAIAMMSSVGIMVDSFRETVLVWLDRQLRADIYVRPSGRAGAGQFPALDPAAPRLVSGVPGVAAVDVFHAIEFRHRGLRGNLGAGDLEIVRRYGRLQFLPGVDREEILRSLPGQDRAIVSEPFANKHNVRAGDRLTLALRDKSVTVTVAGVYYDYSTELGWVILDRSTFLKYLPGQPPANLAIYLQPGVDRLAARRAIEASLVNSQVFVADNRALREGAITVFDRTFAITWALEAVAILVAMLGAANSLLALVLDRRREIGMLRFLGASRKQIRRMILIEAGFIGFLAILLGLALGYALSLLLIYVVNKQSFGWTIQFHLPPAMLGAAVAAIWAATVLAAVYPALVASRLNPIDVVHLE